MILNYKPTFQQVFSVTSLYELSLLTETLLMCVKILWIYLTILI